MNAAEKYLATYHEGVDQRTWLVERGLISSTASNHSVDILNDWRRPGAESYILELGVGQVDGETRSDTRLVAKACIKIPCTPTMGDWVARRRLLSENGVATPTMYAVHRADVLEEYVPYELRQAYGMQGPEGRSKLVADLLRTYQVLADLGFSPRLLGDLRSSGDDVVVVDFGEDLGGASHQPKQVNFTSQAIVSDTLGRSAAEYVRQL